MRVRVFVLIPIAAPAVLVLGDQPQPQQHQSEVVTAPAAVFPGWIDHGRNGFGSGSGNIIYALSNKNCSLFI